MRADGNLYASGFTDFAGNYISAGGLPTGTWFVRTRNSLGYVDELYRDLAIGNGNFVSPGTPVSVTAGATQTAIDFALDLNSNPDGDGIHAAIDQSSTFSSDFTDTLLGGTTTGTITDRGGWNVNVRDISPGGVQATLAGSGGAPARLSICAAGTAEGVVLDSVEESAEALCNAAGSSTVRAFLAKPFVQLRKPPSGAGTAVDLSTGQSATLGSPVVAGPGNTVPITVRFVDDSGATFGSAKLDAGESIDANVVSAGIVQLTVIAGIVEVTIGDQTATLRTGDTRNFGSPADAIDALIAQVEQLLASAGIRNKGTANSITASLTNAKKHLDSDRKTSLNELNALLNKLDAFLKGGQITQRAYDGLATGVRAVIDSID